MSNKQDNFTYYLTNFFTSYLLQKGVSYNTIKSYRDSFKLLLKFFLEKKNVAISKISMEQFNKKTIIEFLGFLENEKKNSINTRNQRLSAIHAFCKYVQMENIDFMHYFQEILDIPIKKAPQKIIEYLTPEAMKLILKQPNQKIKKEFRDLVILSVLYDTGARVQELIDIKVKDIRLDDASAILLHGKGKKDRVVPIMKNTKELLKEYIKKFEKQNEQYLFENNASKPFSRKGISYIVNKYSNLARKESSMIPLSMHPHQFRHTKAMHLLQSGVNLIYIRDFLGHVDIETTEIYAKYDIETKRKAIANAYPDLIDKSQSRWHKDKNLMEWLNSL